MNKIFNHNIFTLPVLSSFDSYPLGSSLVESAKKFINATKSLLCSYLGNTAVSLLILLIICFKLALRLYNSTASA